MRVLIACEFSGIVRDAFRARGHSAISCDLLPGEGLEKYGPHARAVHLQMDVFQVLECAGRSLGDGWEPDLLIGFPPCTYLCNSGIRWLYKGGNKANGQDPERWEKMREAVEFFKRLRGAHVPRVALENPRMHKYAEELLGPGHGNFIQPWQFGHREVKATGFTLKNLPPLVPTKIIRPPDPRFRTQEETRKWSRVHYASPGADRWKERSRTLQGIADAMADQWGSLPV